MIQLRRVVGDSMSPTYKQGQIVIVSLLKKPALHSVVIAVQGGREVMKRVVGIDTNLMVDLRGDNTEHSTDSRQLGRVHVRKILGVVIWPKRPML